MQVAPVSQQIWDMKYRLKTVDGQPVDKTIADSWMRVATELARPEQDQDLWKQRFYEAMEDFQFLPVLKHRQILHLPRQNPTQPICFAAYTLNILAASRPILGHSEMADLAAAGIRIRHFLLWDFGADVFT